MKYILGNTKRAFPCFASLVLVAITGSNQYLRVEASLLENVKQNPEEARALCQHFKLLNEKGISKNSQKAIKEIARKKDLSMLDAEILMTYVAGMNCPDVR